jgi:hypothetical protein
MTTPVPAQKKTKALWALLLPQIPSIISLITQFAGGLPAPYGVIFASVLSTLGVISGAIVHQVSNAPTGMVLVPVPAASSSPSSSGGIGSDWPKP